MNRFILGLCCLLSQIAWSAEPNPATKFTAMIDLKFQPAANPNAKKIHTNVAGKVSEPLQIALAGDDNFFCDLTIAAIPNTAPRQYKAAFQITHVDEQGREQKITSPTLLVLVGQAAHIEVGSKDTELLQVDLVVVEE